MLLFLLLVLAVFLVRVALTDNMCFFLFLLRFFCVWAFNKHNLGCVHFVYALFLSFTFVPARLLWLVLVCCFLAYVMRDEYRRQGGHGHSYDFFTRPSIVHWPTTPIPTIHGHRHTSRLVCVSVASVLVCFWPCARIVRSCTYVFSDVLGVYMCVLGVFPVSRHPKPNPKQV